MREQIHVSPHAALKRKIIFMTMLFNLANRIICKRIECVVVIHLQIRTISSQDFSYFNYSRLFAKAKIQGVLFPEWQHEVMHGSVHLRNNQNR